MIKPGAVVNFSLLSFLSFVRVLFLASPLLTAGDGLRFLQAVLSALLSHCVYSAKLELLSPLSTDTRKPLHSLFFILCLNHF